MILSHSTSTDLLNHSSSTDSFDDLLSTSFSHDIHNDILSSNLSSSFSTSTLQDLENSQSSIDFISSGKSSHNHHDLIDHTRLDELPVSIMLTHFSDDTRSMSSHNSHSTLSEPITPISRRNSSISLFSDTVSNFHSSPPFLAQPTLMMGGLNITSMPLVSPVSTQPSPNPLMPRSSPPFVPSMPQPSPYFVTMTENNLTAAHDNMNAINHNLFTAIGGISIMPTTTFVSNSVDNGKTRKTSLKAPKRRPSKFNGPTKATCPVTKEPTPPLSPTSSHHSEQDLLLNVFAEPLTIPCPSENCQKLFPKSFNIKSHLKTHSTEKNFTCSQCPASFRRSHDLKRHYRSLHTGIKPFQCGNCEKRFSRMDALKRHVSRPASDCYIPSREFDHFDRVNMINF